MEKKDLRSFLSNLKSPPPKEPQLNQTATKKNKSKNAAQVMIKKDKNFNKFHLEKKTPPALLIAKPNENPQPPTISIQINQPKSPVLNLIEDDTKNELNPTTETIETNNSRQMIDYSEFWNGEVFNVPESLKKQIQERPINEELVFEPLSKLLNGKRSRTEPDDEKEWKKRKEIRLKENEEIEQFATSNNSMEQNLTFGSLPGKPPPYPSVFRLKIPESFLTETETSTKKKDSVVQKSFSSPSPTNSPTNTSTNTNSKGNFETSSHTSHKSQITKKQELKCLICNLYSTIDDKDFEDHQAQCAALDFQ